MTDKNDLLSAEEKEIFKKAMHNVKPLRQKSVNTQHQPPKTLEIKPKAKIKPILPKRHPEYLGTRLTNVTSDAIISFHKSGLGKKQLSDLKSAKNKYTAKIDLHGLNLDNASKALVKFVHKQYAESAKLILIIHGKGGKDNKPPLIKNMVNTYLRHIPEVLAFHSALPKDGGQGAIYALLKSKKNQQF